MRGLWVDKIGSCQDRRKTEKGLDVAATPLLTTMENIGGNRYKGELQGQRPAIMQCGGQWGIEEADFTSSS